MLSADLLDQARDLAPRIVALRRAIHAEPVYHAFYAGIILWESVATVLCFAGAFKLWQNRTAPASAFNRAKSTAILGLTVSLLQWFVAFITVGGEWFLMWQSKIWNGQDAALSGDAPV